ncbi:hypothetical protein ABIE44_000541 [Marmoricola sp. OAE513]|uniref:DUF6308 family protein n=1 Tax=Marmoricola sp. OAE513 TaxID=2817894 RepID=UPI003397F2B8
MKLPECLLPGAEERAVQVLRAYYRPHQGARGYTGALFDGFDPNASRTANANCFTSDDLIAVTFLSVDVPPLAAHEILVNQRARFSALLDHLKPDLDFADVPDVSEDAFWPAWDLWRALIDVHGLGPTTVSKLMARKRPRLIPIFDSVIKQYVLGGRSDHWDAMHGALNSHHANGETLAEYLRRLHAMAGMAPDVTSLRVFDVLAWMEGTGNTARRRSRAAAFRRHRPGVSALAQT